MVDGKCSCFLTDMRDILNLIETTSASFVNRFYIQFLGNEAFQFCE